MEFLTILVLSLLSLASPAGLISEQLTASAIRSQLQDAEVLAVRVDNTPSYRVAQGRIERLRVAGRGLYPAPDLRIEALEVETDPITVSPAALQRGKIVLEQPLNAGIRIALTREDINRALRSPLVAKRLQNLSLDLLGSAAAQLERYDLVEPQLELLDSHRLRFQTQLKSQQTDLQLTIAIESGVEILSGRQLQLIDPAISIDGTPLPPQFVELLVGNISQQLDLARLESAGVTARILSWELDRDQIHLAAFVQLDPQVLASQLASQPEPQLTGCSIAQMPVAQMPVTQIPITRMPVVQPAPSCESNLGMLKY